MPGNTNESFYAAGWKSGGSFFVFSISLHISTVKVAVNFVVVAVFVALVASL